MHHLNHRSFLASSNILPSLQTCTRHLYCFITCNRIIRTVLLQVMIPDGCLVTGRQQSIQTKQRFSFLLAQLGFKDMGASPIQSPDSGAPPPPPPSPTLPSVLLVAVSNKTERVYLHMICTSVQPDLRLWC